MSGDIPIVCVVGRSKSGRTTLLESLIPALASRGFSVATVKHHVHDTPVDVPGKDSTRHREAGAAVAMVSGPAWFSVVRRVEDELTFPELAAQAEGADILLAEGYKQTDLPRVETHRTSQGPPLFAAADLFALVTDDPASVGASGWEGETPLLGFDEAEALADLIEDTFLGGGRR